MMEKMYEYGKELLEKNNFSDVKFISKEDYPSFGDSEAVFQLENIQVKFCTDRSFKFLELESIKRPGKAYSMDGLIIARGWDTFENVFGPINPFPDFSKGVEPGKYSVADYVRILKEHYDELQDIFGDPEKLEAIWEPVQKEGAKWSEEQGLAIFIMGRLKRASFGKGEMVSVRADGDNPRTGNIVVRTGELLIRYREYPEGSPAIEGVEFGHKDAGEIFFTYDKIYDRLGIPYTKGTVGDYNRLPVQKIINLAKGHYDSLISFLKSPPEDLVSE